MARASPRTKALQRAKLEENKREKMEKARVRKVTKKDQREEELENNPRAKEKERNNAMFVAIQDTMHGIAGNRFEMFPQIGGQRIYGAGISCVISRWHVERVTLSACVLSQAILPKATQHRVARILETGDDVKHDELVFDLRSSGSSHFSGNVNALHYFIGDA